MSFCLVLVGHRLITITLFTSALKRLLSNSFFIRYSWFRSTQSYNEHSGTQNKTYCMLPTWHTNGFSCRTRRCDICVMIIRVFPTRTRHFNTNTCIIKKCEQSNLHSSALIRNNWIIRRLVLWYIIVQTKTQFCQTFRISIPIMSILGP